MFCTHCGKEIDDNAVICPNCGVTTEKFKQTRPAAQQTQETNGIAVAALVCAFLVPLVGLILGIVALVKSKQLPGQPNHGMSIAAIVIGAVMLVGNSVASYYLILPWLGMLI